MPDISPGAIAAIAAEAARLASDRWRGEIEVWNKEPDHPVSDVDLLVDDFLREQLSALDPDAGYLSEETTDSAARLGKSRIWLVDPIDGTRDFIRGRDGWCVSVADPESFHVEGSQLERVCGARPTQTTLLPLAS